jgi:vitamin B12 transporter
VTNGQVSARLATWDGLLTHRLTGFAARTDRFYNFSAFFSPTGTGYDYFGTRYGAEYQGDLKLGRFGSLTVGLRFEREELESYSEPLLRGSGVRQQLSSVGMNTLSAFALHQFQLGERLDISLAGRVDAVERTNTFITGRATLAYRLPETGTRFRASIGTGAKSPSLYQLYSEYGNLALKPETSIGYDAGVEQNLLEDRLKLSIGLFENRFRDFINFGSNSACNATQPFGCYFNTGRARTRGIEASFSARLIDDQLTLRGSYTFLDALDRQTGLRLTRRAMHQGAIGLDWQPIEKLTLSPSLVLIGARIDEDFDQNFNRVRVRLAPYARLDLAANYKLTSQIALYARAENLLGARIEEVRNYGGTGRAFFGGVQAEW